MTDISSGYKYFTMSLAIPYLVLYTLNVFWFKKIFAVMLRAVKPKKELK